MRDVLVTLYFDGDITRNTAAGAVVIDEVDSMLLDKGENVLYISHDLPEMYDLLALFVDIWAAVNAPHTPEPDEVEEFVRPRISELVPRCLKGFSKRHFSTWVASAWRARHVLVPDDAYKVADVRDGRGAQIVIMDKETGVEQLRTEWSDGLQQFLQLKHGVKWTPPSLRAVYMSNMTYFTQFQGSIYGLTGTLGSKAECDLLSTLYGVEFFKLPRSKRRFCVQEEPVVASSKEQWLDSIVRRVEKVIRDKRAVLVLCENIDAANSVHNRLHRLRIASESYVSSLDEKFKERQQKDLTPGSVLIATNLAGRGTDLKLSEDLAANKGLHLIITFVPDNARVEDQAEGRTARAGQRGSYQFIVLGNSTMEPYEYLCETKANRDRNERKRLTGLLEEAVPKAVLEEHLFRRFFSECCQRPSPEFAGVICDKWHIVRQCLMNKWALWLDENACLIENASDPDTEAKILHRFGRFVMDVNLKRGSSYQLAEIPSELVALARSANKEEAIRLNKIVADIEPDWCENVLVELSRLILAKDAKHPEKKEARLHLKRLRKLIEKRTNDLTGCAKIVSECLEKQTQENPDEKEAFEGTGFTNQINNLIGLWNIHSSAIDKLLGVPLACALGNHFKEDHVREVLEFIGKANMSYAIQERYSRKVKVTYCDASKQKQVFLGEKRIPWPPFLAQCCQPLMDMMTTERYVNKLHIQQTIADAEEKFWEKLVHEGYVSENATRGPCYVLKHDKETDFHTLPLTFKRLEKILADWFKSHDGEDVDLARSALNIQDDPEWKVFVQWLKDKDLVRSQIRTKHRKLREIPSVSENPEANICNNPLEQWAMVLSSWFSSQDGFVSKPNFKERANSFTKQYIDYFTDFGVIKPLKINFCFYRRSRNEIQEKLDDIRSCFKTLNGIGSFADKLYDKGYEKSRELLVNNLMAATNDHIGQLKACEMVESSFTELRETVRKPDDPIFEQRDECEEMESRNLDRVIKVEEKIPFDWNIVWVALIGVAQLVGAIAIPFLSSALMGEGINDLMYAFQCFQSPGSFSWKAYVKQKAQSMAITVVTLGLGAAKLIAASGNSLRNAARLMCRFNGTLKGWIQMGKAVIMRCIDAITSSVVGAAVSKFLNWLKKFLLEKVLERVKSIIFSFFKTPFERMKKLLKRLVLGLVKCGKSVEDAIQKAKDLMEDGPAEETWLSTIKSKATSLVRGMLDVFEGSTGALQGLQSSFADSFASKAQTGNTLGITAGADGGTVAKAIKIGSTIVDYGKAAIRVKECVDQLGTAKRLCTHASDRITNRNTRLEQELTRVMKERLTVAKDSTDDRQMASDEERKIKQFVDQVPGEMQTDIMQHVLDTIQSTWLEPKLQAYAQKKAAKWTSKIAVKVGLLPPQEQLSDSQSSRGDETQSFDEMVDGIGGGDPAGPTEVQNAADALGVNIKIVDETGEYTKGTDKESFSFYSQGNPYSNANEVKVSFTANPDGTKHITLIKPDGTTFSYEPDPSQPPNRCLYDALSRAYGKTPDETISICKSYAKTNERARYMHEVGVDEAYSHLKAGAYRKANSAETKTEYDEFGRITKIQSVITGKNLYQGTASNKSSRARVPKGENLDAAHGVPKSLGGRGTRDNSVPLPRKFNRGQQRIFEGEIFNRIKDKSEKDSNFQTEFEVRYEYEGNSKVPSIVRYDIYYWAGKTGEMDGRRNKTFYTGYKPRSNDTGITPN